MGVLRRVGATIGGLAGGVAALLIFLLVVVAGNSYRKDCLTNRGTISQSWTFNWASPVPFLFRPSESNCVVHVGTRVALNEIGVDTFKPSTAQTLAGHFASATGIDPYWPKLKVTIAELLSREAGAASLTARIAAFVDAQATLAALNPPPAYRSAHQQLFAAITLVLTSDQRAQNALLRGQRPPHSIVKTSDTATRDVNSALTELSRIHSAQ